MVRALLIAFAALVPFSAHAHDAWLDPSSFQATADTPVRMTFQVGHGTERREASLSPRPDWIVWMSKVDPTGAIEVNPPIEAAPAGSRVQLHLPGTHIVALRTSHFTNEMPAELFTAYLEEEGLSSALQFRESTGRANDVGREVYSRFAKVLIRVAGDVPQEGQSVTQPIGASLEIVPERDPYEGGSVSRLPVRVLYYGQPLAGALVTLNDLDSGQWPSTALRTDTEGRAIFDVPRTGRWMLNVVWSRPLQGYTYGDFDTTFSSLTFGFE